MLLAVDGSAKTQSAPFWVPRAGQCVMASIALSRVLVHPSLTPADPTLLSGAEHLERAVRWVHSSEVLDIAPLLRGGELLLTGGEILARSTPAQQRRYIRDLARRRVTAVAIETGTRLPSIPTALLESAADEDFPVIELRRVVPFVQVAEAINAALVDSEVSHLRLSTALAHALSGIVAEGGGTQQVLTELARRTGTSTALFHATGEPIAVAQTSTDMEPRHMSDWTTSAVTAWVRVRGVRVALLAMLPDGAADAELAAVAAERGAEALGVVLLRGRPPSLRDLAEAELVRVCSSSSASPAQVLHLGGTIGMQPRQPVTAIAAACPDAVVLRQLDGLLRQHGTVASDRPTDDETHILLSLRRPDSPALSRSLLLADLRTWSADKSDLTVAVGPVCLTLAGAPLSVSAAVRTLHHPSGATEAVVDTCERIPERLVVGEDAPTDVSRLVDEQFATFAHLTPPDRDRLLTTLECYFDSGCNKTVAADRLHIGRQALYGRLEHAFALLGGDPTGTTLALSVHLMTRLRHLASEWVLDSARPN